MKKLLVLFGLVAILGVQGCSKVEPAHFGKKLTGAGYMPDVLEPGRYWIWPWQSIVKLDGSTIKDELELGVTMRDENRDGSSRIGLEMDFVVSFRYKLKGDPQVVNTIFNDLVIQNNKLSGARVFETYGKNTIENKARELLSQYTPEEALANRKILTDELSAELVKAFANKPVSISDIFITSMTLPPIIEDRIKANKNRELQLAEAEATQAINLAEKTNQIVLAQKEAEKRLIDATAAAEENKKLNQGLTPEVLELRRLENQKIYAEAWLECMKSDGKCGSNTVFMPFDAMSNPGAQLRMFQK